MICPPMSHHPEFYFSDDVKIVLPVSCLDNCNQLQDDIAKLLEWSNLGELYLKGKVSRYILSLSKSNSVYLLP